MFTPRSLAALRFRRRPCVFVAGSAVSCSQRSKGYKYFEEQFPGDKPPERYATYEDQMMGGQATRCEAPVVLTEHEKLVQLHTWEKTEDGNLPTPPPNYGWIEEWGPEPGESGHNDWYKKPREFMSDEEKAKFDMGFQVPLKKHHLRHQQLPYGKRILGAFQQLHEMDPQTFSTKDRNPDTNHTEQQKYDTVGKARAEFLDEWLAKPGVTPENVGKKIADYNGTGKLHNVKKLPRRPDWELAPQVDDDDD